MSKQSLRCASQLISLFFCVAFVSIGCGEEQDKWYQFYFAVDLRGECSQIDQLADHGVPLDAREESAAIAEAEALVGTTKKFRCYERPCTPDSSDYCPDDVNFIYLDLEIIGGTVVENLYNLEPTRFIKGIGPTESINPKVAQ